MIDSFETNEILIGLLRGKTSAKGGCYHEGDRPDNSTEEDIVVNTVDLAIDEKTAFVKAVDLAIDTTPQIGTSNVNIYVCDTPKKIKGKMMLSANNPRLKALAREVTAIIRNSRIHGIKAIPGTMSIMNEPNTKQHFANIRIDWNIQI